MSDLNKTIDRNFNAIVELVNKLQAEVQNQQNKISRLEANVSIMSAEIINAKQMMAHVSGRGMGPTVVE